MIPALEERNAKLANENRELKIKMEELIENRDADVLRYHLECIDSYDKKVQQIIAASSILSEAWDNFRVQYELTASQELLQTAKDKIAGKHSGICHGCGRKMKARYNDFE
jgi:hypothetical protein